MIVLQSVLLSTNLMLSVFLDFLMCKRVEEVIVGGNDETVTSTIDHHILMQQVRVELKMVHFKEER